MRSVLSSVLLVTLSLHAAWAVNSDCFTKKADIVFIMDESSSINPRPFKDQMAFINELISNFDIRADGTRIGLLSFASTPRKQFDMNKFKDDKAGMKNRVTNVRQKGGNTYTWLVLDMAREDMFIKSAGSRVDDDTVPKIAIVITDGNSQEPIRTRAAAKELRETGVNVYAIGVGSERKISQKELMGIGGDDGHVFRVSSYAKLKDIESSVLSAACVTDAPPTLPPVDIYGPCQDKQADVLFVFDTSENALPEQVEGMKDFLARLTYSMDIGADKTRVGLITYSATANLVFGFDQFNSHEDIYTSIRDVQADLAPNANLQAALQLANEQNFNPDQGGRTKIAKALVLITPGKSADSAASVQAARQLMADRGVKIIAIALASASKKELSNIAGADNVIEVADVGGLPAVRDRVAGKICASQPPPDDFECGELRGIDLAFVMNTQSAGGHDMVSASEFLQRTADKFEIGPNATQVAVIPAKCQTLPGFELNRYKTKDTLKGGMTLGKTQGLGKLMRQATTSTFTTANGSVRSKTEITRAIVIVTDGTPDQDSINRAREAKQDGIEVFVVGVGKKVNKQALDQMASDPPTTHVYTVRSYDELVSSPKVIDGITTTICANQ